LFPLAHRLEFEAKEVLVVVVGQLPEDLPVIEEVLEDPVASCLEHGDALAPGDHVEGIGLQGEGLRRTIITIIRYKILRDLT